MVSSYFVTVIIVEYFEKKNQKSLEEHKAKPSSFWVYSICLFIGTNIFMNLNGQFLYFSFYDAFRRVWLMRKLSKSLEGLHSKGGEDLKMPVINFLDKESLLSWLEARRLVLDIGGRFQMRI